MISAAELSELWQRHAGGLELLASARCGPNDAADCVQVAFVKLAQADPIPDDRHAWLATVVRNEALTRIRTQARRMDRERKVAERRGQFFDASATENAIGDWTESQLIQLEGALRGLASDDREIVVARIWGGMGFREIAALTHRSRSDIHRRYHRALRWLKSQLTEHSDAFADLLPCSDLTTEKQEK